MTLCHKPQPVETFHIRVHAEDRTELHQKADQAANLYFAGAIYQAVSLHVEISPSSGNYVGDAVYERVS